MNRPATIEGMPVITSTKKRHAAGRAGAAAVLHEVDRRRGRAIGIEMRLVDQRLLERADDAVVDAAAGVRGPDVAQRVGEEGRVDDLAALAEDRASTDATSGMSAMTNAL